MVVSLLVLPCLAPLSVVDIVHVVHQPFFVSAGIVSFAFLLWILVFNRGAKSRDLLYPPGPKPLPLVGNLHQVNTAEPWLTYTAWKKKYGEFDH